MMTIQNAILASLIRLAASSATIAGVQTMFYVAPNGNDAQPFAAIERRPNTVR